MQDAERHARYLKFRAVRLLAEEATLEGTGLLTRWDQRNGLLNNLLSHSLLNSRSNAELGGPSISGGFVESSAHRIARMGTVVPVDLTHLGQNIISLQASSPAYPTSDTVASISNAGEGSYAQLEHDGSTVVRRPSVAMSADLKNNAGEASEYSQAAFSPVMDFDHLSMCDEPEEESLCPEGHFGGETGSVVDATPALEPDGAAAEDLASLGVATEDETVYERKGCGQVAVLGRIGPGEGTAQDKELEVQIMSDSGLRNAVHDICLRSVLQVSNA